MIPGVKHVTLSFPREPRCAAAYSATITFARSAWTATLTAADMAAQYRELRVTSAVWCRPRHVCRFAQNAMLRSASIFWKMDTYVYAKRGQVPFRAAHSTSIASFLTHSCRDVTDAAHA